MGAYIRHIRAALLLIAGVLVVNGEYVVQMPNFDCLTTFSSEDGTVVDKSASEKTGETKEPKKINLKRLMALAKPVRVFGREKKEFFFLFL